MMKITNLSAEPEGLLRSWLPNDLQAEHIVFLPDACPGKSPLPTGSVVLTRQSDWQRFAVSDCGCGMRLLRSQITSEELTQQMWDEIALSLKANKGMQGDLGGGNHFLDAILPYDEDILYFLIHTGSRKESGIVDDLVDKPAEFDRQFKYTVEWAEQNRKKVQETLEATIGPAVLILDHPHNTFEQTEDGIIIRKGAVRLSPGGPAVIPSHMTGDCSLVTGTGKLAEILFSMSHGTGRTMSRGEAKTHSLTYDFDQLFKNVMLPSFLNKNSLTTEGPFAYRELDDCLALISDYVKEIKRFSVVGYMGHL